jgi:hypothetical protein
MGEQRDKQAQPQQPERSPDNALPWAIGLAQRGFAAPDFVLDLPVPLPDDVLGVVVRHDMSDPVHLRGTAPKRRRRCILASDFTLARGIRQRCAAADRVGTGGSPESPRRC